MFMMETETQIEVKTMFEDALCGKLENPIATLDSGINEE